MKKINDLELYENFLLKISKYFNEPLDAEQLEKDLNKDLKAVTIDDFAKMVSSILTQLKISGFKFGTDEYFDQVFITLSIGEYLDLLTFYYNESLNTLEFETKINDDKETYLNLSLESPLNNSAMVFDGTDKNQLSYREFIEIFMANLIVAHLKTTVKKN